MKFSLDEMIRDTDTLPLVPLAATAMYQKKTPVMKKFMDDTMGSNLHINDLIGNNPLQVMFDNHNHHAAFMATVFSVGSYELLVRVMQWVYRAYSGHNFSYNYFTLELRSWIEAVEKNMDPKQTPEIISVYKWMLDHHEDMISLSQAAEKFVPPMEDDWLEKKNSFLAAVLTGDHRRCLDIAEESISSGNDLIPFYLHIIQPVMYEVGMLWERGEISVAQEHLASAIVGRVMVTTSLTDVIHERVAAKAVVTSAPNEFHEIGAWMISDVIEHEGWEVRYLGANTPLNDLLEMLHSFQPEVLAISVTMPFNILNAKDIVSAVKGDEKLNSMKIIVGGRSFNDTPELWRTTGADFFAANAQQLKILLAELS